MKAKVIILCILALTICQARSSPKGFEDLVRAFMKGAKLDEYVVDSEKCLDSIDETTASFADLFGTIREHGNPNSTVRVYPEIILSTTDVLASFSPLA
jgi:hypothetical protein